MVNSVRHQIQLSSRIARFNHFHVIQRVPNECICVRPCIESLLVGKKTIRSPGAINKLPQVCVPPLVSLTCHHALPTLSKAKTLGNSTGFSLAARPPLAQPEHRSVEKRRSWDRWPQAIDFESFSN
ncbi:hypothetical protein BCEP4_760011 [Burkholderia cepacia]|nr:hypothetical protein BCEP4_760011 [Burkholderia cepacia]